MKKICAMIMAAALLLTLCACNIKDVTKIVTVGGESISKGEFNFYLQQAKSQTVSKAQQDNQTLSMDSPAETWDSVMVDGKTAKEYAIDLAKDNAKKVLVLKAKAVADGITLTEEDKDNLKKQRQQIIEQLGGGRYSYEQTFAEAGYALDDIEKILENELYASKIQNKYLSDEIEAPADETDAEEEAKEETKDNDDEEAAESEETEEAAEDVVKDEAPKTVENPDAIKVTDEQALESYKKDYVYVKHILISNTKTEEAAPEDTEAEADAAAETGEAADEPAETEETAETEDTETAEELDEQAKAKAEDLIKQLEGGADFDKLMKENSDDKNSETGEVNGLEGYIFTKGEMVSEFEEAAFALEVGGMTKEPVKTSYGYHIIKRLELPESGDLFEQTLEGAKDKVKSDLWDSMVEQWAEEFGVTYNDRAISKIKF
ncbi:MAG: peptidylprolyl isomerase [Clostridia bacterium]|nr:peptidylprolyl isomerase [Clostridia bacterium]